MKFNHFIGVDWSGAKRANGVAVAMCPNESAPPECVSNPEGGKWRRCDVLEWLSKQITDHGPVLIGLDFAFGFPWKGGEGYFPRSHVVLDDTSVLWQRVQCICGNDVDLYAGSFVTEQPYSHYFMRPKKPGRSFHPRLRKTEMVCRDSKQGVPQSVFNLVGAKQVGRASLSGMRMLHHLQGSRGDRLKIWPFDFPEDGYSACVEIFPMHFIVRAGSPAKKIRTSKNLEKTLKYYGTELPRGLMDPLSDHVTDALVSAAALRRLYSKSGMWSPKAMTADIVRREGWIFGVH